MGSAPGRPVQITQGFWMGQHPVTNDAYARFLAGAKRGEPAYWRNARFNKPDLPVVGVDHRDAVAFCAWATVAAALDDGLVITLPTEAEWEYTARAAGGDRLRTYPWGDEEPTPERAVFHSSDGTAAVGGRPAGATPLGVHDMAGNVWEWCLDAWQEERPGDADPIAEPPPESAAARVVWGGSWFSDPGYLRAAYRGKRGPDYRSQYLGFRVVCRGSRQHGGH
jgi:iron(II)-dependent oxidoreductase